MEANTVAAQLERRDDETDTAWIERLRAHFAAERREQIRRDAKRWVDSGRQP